MTQPCVAHARSCQVCVESRTITLCNSCPVCNEHAACSCWCWQANSNRRRHCIAASAVLRHRVLLMRRQRERIFFNSRKGIVAIAIRAGVDIMPTYFLGQSQART